MSDADRELKRDMENDSEPDINNIDGYIDRDIAGVYDVPKEEQISSMEDLDNLPLAGEEEMKHICTSECRPNSHIASPIAISITDDNGKECTKCKAIKELRMFGKDKKSPDGLTYWCKDCTIQARRTKNGVVIKIYNSQVSNSKKRGHTPPSYSQDELREWLFSQQLFHEIYDTWKLSGFVKELSPSVDRTSEQIGYTMSNIKLMTFDENRQKHFKDVVNGIGNMIMKPVTQITKDGEEVQTFHSISEAFRQTDIHISKISLVCNGHRKTAGGYKWKF